MTQRRKLEGVADRLREAALASGKTPKEIQTEAGVARSLYYAHLNGEHAMSELHIARYCLALGVSADWLLGIRRKA